MAHKKAIMMREAGEAQTFIPLEGQLALMLDKIKRFYKTGNPDEILGLAADSLFALEAVMGDAEEPLGDDTPPHEDLPKEDEGTLPQEFVGWSQDEHKAQGLRDYLISARLWGSLSEEDKKRINDVAGYFEESTTP